MPQQSTTRRYESICLSIWFYLLVYLCCERMRKVSSHCGQTYCSPELFHSRLRSEPTLQPSISRCFAQTRHRAAGRQKSWGVKTKTVDDAINHKVWWLYDRICSLNPSQISQILEYCYKAEFAAAFFGSKFSDSDFKNPGTFERSWDEGAQVALESQWTAEFMLGKEDMHIINCNNMEIATNWGWTCCVFVSKECVLYPGWAPNTWIRQPTCATQ